MSSAARRLWRDRTAVAFGALFLLLALAFFAAPLYASDLAETTFAENRLSEQITVDGERTFIVSLEGVPIGPTWEGSYFLGADQNGRDLIVRLLYGWRNSLVIGAGAVLLTVLLAVPLALVAGFFRGRVDALITRLLDLRRHPRAGGRAVRPERSAARAVHAADGLDPERGRGVLLRLCEPARRVPRGAAGDALAGHRGGADRDRTSGRRCSRPPTRTG